MKKYETYFSTNFTSNISENSHPPKKRTGIMTSTNKAMTMFPPIKNNEKTDRFPYLRSPRLDRKSCQWETWKNCTGFETGKRRPAKSGTKRQKIHVVLFLWIETDQDSECFRDDDLKWMTEGYNLDLPTHPVTAANKGLDSQSEKM